MRVVARLGFTSPSQPPCARSLATPHHHSSPPQEKAALEQQLRAQLADAVAEQNSLRRCERLWESKRGMQAGHAMGAC